MTEQVDNIALREALKKMFSVGTHSLQFTKKDGTVREMIATRDPALMPFETYEKWLVPNVEKPRKESETSLPVYEIAVEGFRSFGLDSLINVDGLTTEQIVEIYK
ncbi:SH3 beta-barrel fold-containing protein [Escherichia coli]